jgi:two-component system response regulator PilR (NtrC family)
VTTLTGDILVVDDERSIREFLEIYLRRSGHRVEVAVDGEAGVEALTKREYDIVITDLRMPKGNGLDVLAKAKERHPETQVIVVTAFATAETAVAAMKAGAYDYLTKPFKIDEVGMVVARALERRALHRENIALRDEIKGRYKLDRLIGKSAAMRGVFEILQKIAVARTNVLLIGESGTGKELAARALHELSPRAGKPFVAINCGAIPEALIESELFGHVRGSFTGASTGKQGLFEAAHGGTLLLDEIADLPTAMQVKLLRVLQERKVKPVGDVAEREVDVRVIAATNRDLEHEVSAGAFRQDLYYRLNVIQVRLPPLRERREDIALLVDHFVHKFSAEHGRQITGTDPRALSVLLTYDFPGNVRELENNVERAVTLSSGDRITIDALPPLGNASGLLPSPPNLVPGTLPVQGLNLEHLTDEFERGVIGKTLTHTGGNRTEAARLLGVTFRSLRYRLAKLGITAAGGKDAEDPKKPVEG